MIELKIKCDTYVVLTTIARNAYKIYYSTYTFIKPSANFPVFMIGIGTDRIKQLQFIFSVIREHVFQ